MGSGRQRTGSLPADADDRDYRVEWRAKRRSGSNRRICECRRVRVSDVARSRRFAFPGNHPAVWIFPLFCCLIENGFCRFACLGYCIAGEHPARRACEGLREKRLGQCWTRLSTNRLFHSVKDSQGNKAKGCSCCSFGTLQHGRCAGLQGRSSRLQHK